MLLDFSPQVIWNHVLIRILLEGVWLEELDAFGRQEELEVFLGTWTLEALFPCSKGILLEVFGVPGCGGKWKRVRLNSDLYGSMLVLE